MCTRLRKRRSGFMPPHGATLGIRLPRTRCARAQFAAFLPHLALCPLFKVCKMQLGRPGVL